ncbi:cyclic AMP-responsive element-binding protein 3-like protein 2 [Corythoichthys intestinalis]|uniref:cyclic AMP-responsive element-binding protein 3-like protein 2 n=1 Tax=Corythoichthys intestinalis TaxID=161448 RepID=UPI0025A651FF|nr:cyclic AMP-responsive element-binding protein 3-like protein 2 [Corythoichthys intestinalis]XP_061809196.1 cyclic AMP-responsive element-binding protein 3-like protein 2 [Nerophis lumbriciformis]
MEILDSSESLLHWDRNLSELSEAGDMDCALYTNHFSELLDDLSHDALLGQLLSDPFLSGARGCGARSDDGEGEDRGDLCASSPLPHIAAEHSYSLCGDSRPQSPLSHLTGERGSDAESEGDSSEWPMEQDDGMEGLLCRAPSLLLALGSVEDPRAPEDPAVSPPRSPVGSRNHDKSVKVKEEEVFPEIKLEPHEVDQFLNLSPKGLEALQMPPTPPSSHGSDSEGSQSPVRALPGLSRPTSPAPAQLKASPRGNSSSSLSNSPLLTAPHKLQGSGPLMLTEEERRTLVAEGYPVPTKLPLTKAEEKALKKIRRKIKNKISAQESRRKKKEYMDTLEKKVETCSNENNDLRRKVDTLECTNKSLLQQLQALQALLSGKVSKSCRAAGTQTSSCLMVVVLCFALFLGSFYPTGLTSESGPVDSGPASGRLALKESYTATVKSRSLLSTFEDEPPPVLGLGGEYPDQWEDATGAVVMAAWRRSGEQHHKITAAETSRAEMHPPFRSKSNTTTADGTYRSFEQRATSSIALERSVNETS